MWESAKALLGLVVIVCLPGSLIVWALDRVDLATRLGFTIPCLVASGLLAWMSYRKGKVPDFLRRLVRHPFERDGLCFGIVPDVEGGRFRLNVYYQNRFEGRCFARVMIQPSQEFLLNRRPISSMLLKIECDGGAFGVARFPLAIPADLQGRSQAFDVSASVMRPERARCHTPVSCVGREVVEPKPAALAMLSTVAFAFIGHISIHYPSQTKYRVRLPIGVADSVVENSSATIETLWRPGDPTPAEMSARP